MAKGDDSRARNRIDYEKNLSQAHLDNLRKDTIVPQNQQFWNYFQEAIPQAQADYSRLSGGYDEFAKTGGFSPQDLANIRARAVSPTRAVYANAGREVDRQRALQGGYSPGYGTLKARMAREMGQGISDASTNAEAAIAGLVQQGKLAGLSGGSNLYSATPGMASMFGNQVLQSTGQQLDLAQLQNQLGLGTMGAQVDASKLPGKWESTMGRINDIFNIGKKVGGAVGGWRQ